MKGQAPLDETESRASWKISAASLLLTPDAADSSIAALIESSYSSRFNDSHAATSSSEGFTEGRRLVR